MHENTYKTGILYEIEDIEENIVDTLRTIVNWSTQHSSKSIHTEIPDVLRKGTKLLLQLDTIRAQETK